MRILANEQMLLTVAKGLPSAMRDQVVFLVALGQRKMSI